MNEKSVTGRGNLVIKGVVLVMLMMSAIFTSSRVMAQVVINEACSYNGVTLQDEDGSEPDWLELFNSGTASVNLLNYSLTSGNSEPWFFPNVIIHPQQFLLVFASGKNRTAPLLHTSFKLSKTGDVIRLFHPNGTLAGTLTTPGLHLDHSFGLKPDGVAGSEGIFNDPSPGTTNQLSDQFTGYTHDPVFSLNAGFYNGSRILEISTTGNSTVHYTSNGDEPNPTSPVFQASLTIDTTTAIRARSFSGNATILPSRVVTRSFILNYHTTLPVFSITTNPDYLWDWNTGIYVDGPNASPVYPHYGANYWMDVEIPAHIEFFESDGTLRISQPAGVQIHGGTSSRTKPMKSLRLSNKNKFGGGVFSHRFFDEKPIDEFKFIVLRNSSGDFNKTHFRDGTLHQYMIGNTNIDLTAYRPSVVFLNGTYFGVHNIREKISKYYLEENHGIDGDSVDLLEEDSLVIEGDFNAFNSMYAFITGNDMQDQAMYETAAAMIDINSLSDYYIAETFLSNIDWPYNNLKLWKSHEPGAKWRYILIDLDIALGNNGWAPVEFDVLGRIMGVYGDSNRHVHIFRSLLDNNGFREYFINRYADLVNTLFLPDSLTNHILKTREVLYDEMPVHFNKWGNTMSGWDHEIFQIAMPHVYNRPPYAMQQVKDVFSLAGIVTLELDVWPPHAGAITINTITPGPLPWKGDYFNGNPVTLTINPKPGFHFVKWESDQILLPDNTSTTIKVNPSASNRITAYFGLTDDENQLYVFPNPAKNTAHFSGSVQYDDKGTITITNASGQVVVSHAAVGLKKGINKFQMDVSTLPAGVYMLQLQSANEVLSARIIIL